MCLVVVAWRAHPRYPLIVAGNRDEFHARASAPADWWENAAHVFGGRDLVAGGSWLAVSRAGRFAVVLNDPRRPPAPEHSASRGQLVRDFVAGNRPSGRYIDTVAVNQRRYAGFSLLVGTPVRIRALNAAGPGAPRRWTLKPGVHAFSNAPPEEPWPKALHLQTAVEELAGNGALAEESLLALLARREPVSDGPEEERRRRTPFVLDEHYGTRSSTVFIVDEARHCRFIERRFDPAGRPSGESRAEFGLDQPPSG
jgi:uncharacterized protein with NRDE domain